MRLALSICLSLLAFSLWAQPPNDDCLGAILIPTTNDYCSEPQEFTNVGATADVFNPASVGTMAAADCVFTDFDNGIWFILFPEQPGALITINCGTPNGFCLSPQAILFTGSCTSSAGLEYVSCTPGNSLEVAEYTVTDLTIGQRYYLFIKSDDPGAMQVCVDDFVPVPSPESDCPEAVVLCDKSTFQVDFLNTEGVDDTELDEFEGRCLDREFNSAWYKWTCKDAGSLTFTLTPNNNEPGREPDDIDFALFELPNGLDDCSNKDMIRCMASGGCSSNFQDYIQCTGPTGLDLTSTDTEEDAGCFGSACAGATTGAGVPPQNDDNFISAVNMVSGRSYALVVMNFSATGQGFAIDFGGTGTFQGPEPDFNPLPIGDTLACDKLVTFSDLSIPGPDPIISWSWNFGSGANPQTSTDQNPDPVSYDTFGEKSATLTVETSRGCLVTKIVDVRVGACCEDFDPPVLFTSVDANVCPGDENGQLSFTVALGTGNEEFNYNVDPVQPEGVFLPNPSISGLASGTYTILVQDAKGCLDTNVVVITEPDPVFVNAGEDFELELGSQDMITATIDPPGTEVSYAWSSVSENETTSECLTPGLDCIGSDTLDCFDPIVTAQGTQTFTITITDENGCTSTDQVTVTTNVVRPVYNPTAIGLNFGGGDDVFTLGFGRQVKLVREFHIFDRWGNIIFSGENIDIDQNGEMVQGWDGRFGNESSRTTFVNPGVYVWYAKVLFIDGEVLPYAGDVTVVR